MTKLLIAAGAAAFAAPALVGLNGKPLAMNREDYLHESTSRAHRARYGRKDGTADADIQDLRTAQKDMAKAMADRDKQMAEALEKAKAEITNTGKMAQETLDQLKSIATSGEAMQKRMLEIEQKFVSISEHNRGQRASMKSLGNRVAESDEVKKFMSERGGRVRVSVKAITSDVTGAGGAGDLVVPTRVPGIVADPDRILTVRSLLASARTTSNAIEYVQETGFDNQAAPVAEAAEKPESQIEFQLQTVGVKTIAHWIHVTKQIYDDAAMLAGYIDNRLRFGLKIVEEDQLLAGDGTGQNLLGLIPEAADFNRANTGTKLDVIRRSITQVRLAEYRATGVILHPGDWEEIELLKTDEGAYIWANPMGLLNPTVWGLSVVDTVAIDEGQFLTGAFSQAATVWDREDANVQISEHDRDNFIKNMLTVRAEERLALTVFRPEALVHGTFAEGLQSQPA